MNDNIDERIDKLLNKIDKMNEEIKNLIDKQKENNKKYIELERKLENDKQKRKKFRKWRYKGII